MNRYVIIRDKSAGNESVGEMWQETKIFNGDSTLDEVMTWAWDSTNPHDKTLRPSARHIQITRPDDE